MSNVKPIYDQFMAVITEIDEKLDSLEDPASSGKRKIANDLVEEHKGTWESAANGLISQLENMDEDKLVGVYKGYISAITKNFDKKIAEILEKKVENMPKQEALITPEQAAELSKQRSELYAQVKMAVSLAKSAEGIDLEMPKPRRGSRGKRGARALTLMEWAIDGEVVDPQPETLKDFAISLGFEDSKTFYAYLKEKGVNTTKPENGQLRVELPNGKELYGEIPEDKLTEEVDESPDNGDEDEPEAE